MVAVSGGVDSVVLLHALQGLSGVRLTIAHYDHGIRPDSGQDRLHVQQLARQYRTPFVYERGNLGAGASEALAREARYAFLRRVAQASGARGIITAHHQDDVLETIILNLLRGTGRRGLSSLGTTGELRRPMLHVPKKAVRDYAVANGLVWREDSTNTDTRYLRNYIRTNIVPRFSAADRERLLLLGAQTAALNHDISEQIANYLHVQPNTHVLDRHMFIMLPHAVAREVLAEWLLQHGRIELSRKLLERLVVAAKTGRSGSRVNINAGHWLYISPTTLALVGPER